MSTAPLSSDDRLALGACRQAYLQIGSELAKVIVGQEDVIEAVWIAMLARGHVLLEGVPGLARTLLVRSLARATQLEFRRIPCTPDLEPSEITGAEVLREDPATGSRSYRFLPGPLLGNVVLADEVNLAPPRTQAVLLEAMEQRQITLGSNVYEVPDPFFVLAVQDPMEQEGTSPLRGPQLDHFLLHVKMEYPSGTEEWEMARREGARVRKSVEPSLTRDDLLRFQELSARVPVSDAVLGYAWTLVRATRPTAAEAPEFVDRWIARGAGPRGLQAVVRSAKARAALHGRDAVTIGDIQAVVLLTLRHRITENFGAESQNLNSDRLLSMIMESLPADEPYQRPLGAVDEDEQSS